MEPGAGWSSAAASFLDNLALSDSELSTFGADAPPADALAEERAAGEAAAVPGKPATKVDVPAETFALLAQPSNTTYAESPLNNTVQEILSHPLAGSPVSQLDWDTDTLQNFFFDEEAPKLHASKQVLASMLAISPENIEPKMGVLAESLLVMEKRCRALLEESVAASEDTTNKLLLYIDLSKYDETPMPVTHRQDIAASQAAAPGSGGPRPAGAADVATDSSTRSVQLKASTVSKMLSCQEHFAFLIECQVEGPSGLTVDYVSFIGNSLTCNQLLEKNTGKNLATAVTEGMSISKHAEKFAMKCRVAVTDLFSGNLTGEQHIMGLRGPG